MPFFFFFVDWGLGGVALGYGVVDSRSTGNYYYALCAG